MKLISWILLLSFATTGYATTREEIQKWAKSYDYANVTLLEAIIQRESGFNPLKFNPEKSGSYGLMQIQCTTAKDKRLESPLKFSCDQLFNAQINVRYGIMYLKMIERMLIEPTVKDIIASYNAGFDKKVHQYIVKGCVYAATTSGFGPVLTKAACLKKGLKPRRCKSYNVFRYPGFPPMECFPGEYINEAYVWKVHRLYKHLKEKEYAAIKSLEAKVQLKYANMQSLAL